MQASKKARTACYIVAAGHPINNTLRHPFATIMMQTGKHPPYGACMQQQFASILAHMLVTTCHPITQGCTLYTTAQAYFFAACMRSSTCCSPTLPILTMQQLLVLPFP
jgi:hypothetical protein